jgi:peptidoglycan/xylan/chitin deacetylase (PgdA/CDA1 family)
LSLAALAAGLAVLHAGPGLTGLAPVRRRLFPRLAGIGRPDHVALTFDDGPDPVTTPAFAELLAAHQVRATFFLLGSMVAKAPRLAADLAAAGHELGVHGWEHRYSVLRTPWATAADLTRARDLIAEASGTAPVFYRPAYGVLSGASLAAAAGLGLTPVLWSCAGREWATGATTDSVRAALGRDLAGGSCVLLHDSDCTSPPGAAAAALGALPWLLESCTAAGLSVGPLAEHGLVTGRPPRG